MKKAVDVTFVAMKKYTTDEDIQYQCCHAIVAFAKFGAVDMSNALQRFNSAELLQKALKQFAANERILWVCCSAIQAVAESSRGNLRSLRKLKTAKVRRSLLAGTTIRTNSLMHHPVLMIGADSST